MTDVASRILTGGSIFRQYRPLAGAYDEMFAEDGALRPHWRQFVQLVDGVGAAELGRRWQQAQRLIQENGVTYNAHGDPQGRDRRWELDPLPLLMPSGEWSRLK